MRGPLRRAEVWRGSFFLQERHRMNLEDFFHQNPHAALGFSGGVDSAYLLYAAVKSGAHVRAYYVKSAFQPEFELKDAVRLAEELQADFKILNLDILADGRVAENPADRCYFCKKRIFSAIAAAAQADGFPVLMDGTNASDDAGDRPGMKALRELKVCSPLRECGLMKSRIRELSREAGLFTWNKPAYACLATRIPSGERITAGKLEHTEQAENFLFSAGFTDFRVRLCGGAAKLQVPAAQFPLILKNRTAIVKELKKNYSDVLLDLEARDES